MHSIRSLAPLTLALIAAAAVPAAAQSECPCVMSNNGNGTVTLPVICPSGYLGTMVISDGLPGTSTIQIDAVLGYNGPTSEVAGGTLGGNIQTGSGLIEMTMTGTGDLDGFNRFINLPVTIETHSAPRTPGDAVQSFDHDMFRLEGELFGDPDFCTLRVRGGNDFGLPSPGHTTLTRLGVPGTDFQVDSFFDIAYQIEFVGCPGSILEGFGGTTTDQSLFAVCGGAPVPVETTSWGRIKALHR